MVQHEMRLFGRTLEEVAHSMAYYACLRTLWSVMESRCEDPGFSLGAAARDAGTSRNRLNGLLSKTLGMTFLEFLTRYRLLRSIRHMGSTDAGILEVALSGGFGSVRSFERNFRKVLGTSPREYRSLMRSPGGLQGHASNGHRRSGNPHQAKRSAPGAGSRAACGRLRLRSAGAAT